MRYGYFKLNAGYFCDSILNDALDKWKTFERKICKGNKAFISMYFGIELSSKCRGASSMRLTELFDVLCPIAKDGLCFIVTGGWFPH